MQSVALYRALPSMLLLSALCGLGKCQAANWPLSRADAAGTGATTEELPADLDLLWEYKLEGIGFESGPIVVDGIVYACDYDGRVVAVELETGKEKWKLELDTVFVASPAYDQGVLYVGDYEGKFRALDASTGKEKWMFDASLQIDAGANFYRDTLLVTSEEGTLYCLNKLDGQLVWKYETGNQLQCSATLAGRITYLGGCDEHLHIVDVESGKAISEPVSISAPTGSTPSVMDNTIFVPTYAGEILAFPAGEVQPRWRFNDESLGGEFKNSVAVANGKVVASSCQKKRVFALDAKSGQILWQQTLRKVAEASPIIAGNSVIVAAADGRILRFDLQTGKETWMMEVKAGFRGAPAVSDGKLVVANDRGTIFCFGAKK